MLTNMHSRTNLALFSSGNTQYAITAMKSTTALEFPRPVALSQIHAVI